MAERRAFQTRDDDEASRSLNYAKGHKTETQWQLLKGLAETIPELRKSKS